jgi:hypothetical protein
MFVVLMIWQSVIGTVYSSENGLLLTLGLPVCCAKDHEADLRFRFTRRVDDRSAAPSGCIAALGAMSAGCELGLELARTAIGRIADVFTRRNAQKILVSLPSNRRS